MEEAMLGMDYVLPVNPVVRYHPAVNELMVPVTEIPPQDPAPWVQALGRLLTDSVHYEELAQRSRTAALKYARAVTVEPFETYLEERLAAPRRSPLSDHAPPEAPHPVHALSAERRRLLAARLKRRKKPGGN
jgi:hypothetical protein